VKEVRRKNEKLSRTVSSDLHPRRTEVVARLGQMWKAMSDEEKAPYVSFCEADKQQYQIQMAEYIASGFFLRLCRVTCTNS
jgi:hypothetical protein